MLKLKVDPFHLNHHIDVHKSFLDEVTSIYSGISTDNLDQATTFLKFITPIGIIPCEVYPAFGMKRCKKMLPWFV